MHNRSKVNVRYLVTLAMLTAILLVMGMTPLGTLPLGPLSVSFIMIPVAIGGIILGPLGGLIMGGVFGIVSYLQCFGVGITSAMGAVLVEIDPFLTLVQRLVPRLLAGYFSGLVFQGMRKVANVSAACLMTGFCAAFFNTVLFMVSLVLIFGSTDYLKEMIGGQNILLFICTFVGIQAVVEMIVDTVIVGAVGPIVSKVRR